MIPCDSDNDSGSVDLQLSNLEDIKKDPSSLELTGKKEKGFFFLRREVGKRESLIKSSCWMRESPQLDFDGKFGP